VSRHGPYLPTVKPDADRLGSRTRPPPVANSTRTPASWNICKSVSNWPVSHDNRSGSWTMTAAIYSVVVAARAVPA
jgi:hypothetical protein